MLISNLHGLGVVVVIAMFTIGCSSSPTPKKMGISSSDTGTPSGSDTGNSTDTGTNDTTTQQMRCTPDRVVVQTPGTELPIANQVQHAQWSSCVDPNGHWNGVRQVWFGDIDNTVWCMYTWEAQSSNLLVDDCVDLNQRPCDWAFQFNWGSPIEDGTTLCSDGWWAPGALYSPTDIRIGFTEIGPMGEPEIWWDIDDDGLWDPDFYVDPWPGLLSTSFNGTEWWLLYEE